MDIYGDQITIQQAYCRRMESDQGLPTTIGFTAEILRSGDVFSVCGQPQKHMTVGELAMCGRLNHRTFEYDFVRVIPPGSPHRGSLPDAEGAAQAIRAQLRLQPGDCAVLWCGGYNTWTDVETLFLGLDAAMEQDPSLHYVSVGASTYQAHANAYERFVQRSTTSRYAERYHLLGWKPWGEVPSYYRACNVGLNIDALHYETLYGTRTRLVEMIAGGLPIVTTEGTELSALLGQRGAALTFQAGDHGELSRCLQRLASSPALRQDMAAAAVRTSESDLSFRATTAPLRTWLKAPASAPDAIAGHAQRRGIALHHRLRARGRLAVWQLVGRQRATWGST
jgi:glycosyltransferase involved in cell wall biosynthesis